MNDPIIDIEQHTRNFAVRWNRTKAALQAAQEDHLQSEIAIYNEVEDQLPDRGTFQFGDIKIVTGFTEKWDQAKLNEIYNVWDQPLKFPFKGEWKPDGKAISYLRENAPEAYRMLSDALTLTERKPLFSLKEHKE
jgi:hypothetical protein